MHRSLAVGISVLVLTMTAAPASQAAETVWSGLVMAENVTQPQPIPSELTRIEGSLKRFFGYNQFQVIGKSQKVLKTGQEDWLATSKFFGLHGAARRSQTALRAVPLPFRNAKKFEPFFNLRHARSTFRISGFIFGKVVSRSRGKTV